MQSTKIQNAIHKNPTHGHTTAVGLSDIHTVIFHLYPPNLVPKHEHIDSPSAYVHRPSFFLQKQCDDKEPSNNVQDGETLEILNA